MQNSIPIQDLEARLSRANRKVSELRATLNAADDVDRAISLEAQLAGAVGFRDRTAAALEQRQAQEAAEREQNEMRSTAERMAELSAMHREGSSEIAATVNRAAWALEPFVAVIRAKQHELSALNSEYVHIQHKSSDKHIFRDELERLTLYPNAPVPGAADLPVDKSALYDNIMLAIVTALHDAVDGPYTLARVMGIAQNLPPTTMLGAGEVGSTAATGDKEWVPEPEKVPTSYGTAATRAAKDRANSKASRGIAE